MLVIPPAAGKSSTISAGTVKAVWRRPQSLALSRRLW